MVVSHLSRIKSLINENDLEVDEINEKFPDENYFKLLNCLGMLILQIILLVKSSHKNFVILSKKNFCMMLSSIRGMSHYF